MKGNKHLKRVFAIALCAMLLFGNLQMSGSPFVVTAAENNPAPEQACEHHTHDEACGYDEAAGTECTYECTICEVQALIDALPEADGITKENAEEVTAQINAVLEAVKGLDEAQAAMLSMERCTAAADAVSALDATNPQDEENKDEEKTDPQTTETEEDTDTAKLQSCAHHTHDETCGYDAQTGEGCTYECLLCKVQALIDALPALSDMENMSDDDLQAAMEQYAAAREAYNTLTDEQKEQITGVEIFDDFPALISEGTLLADATAEEVQAMIDALPEYSYTMTTDEKESAKTQLAALDEALGGLDKEQQKFLDMNRALNLCCYLNVDLTKLLWIEGTDYGLITNADGTKTYKVVGQYGYVSYNSGYSDKYIRLYAEDTLDLTEADTHNNAVTRATTACILIYGDNVTIVSSSDKVFDNVHFQVLSSATADDEHVTVTLQDYQCNVTGTGSTWLFNKNTEVIYDGKCLLPNTQNTRAIEIIFKPYDTDAALDIRRISGNYAEIVFDGGNVSVNQGIEGKSVAIKNYCIFEGELNSNSLGDNHVEGVIDSDQVTIKDSTVTAKITEKSYNNASGYPNGSAVIGGHGNDSLYPAWNGLPEDSYIHISNSKVTVDNSIGKNYTGIGQVGEIRITDGSVVEVIAPDVKCNESYYRTAGIGGVFETITIENSTVTAGGHFGAGIGWDSGYFVDLSSVKGTINITDSIVTANSVYGSGIGSGRIISIGGPSKYPSTNINITGKSDVKAYSVNGAGIGGGMKKAAVDDPIGEGIPLIPSIGGGWGEDGSTSGGASMSRMLRMGSRTTGIGDSAIPAEVLNYVYTDKGTLAIKANDSGTPSVYAESGICAITMENVITARTIVQNTLKATHESSDSIELNISNGTATTKLGDLRRGFRSVASTVDNVSGNIQLLYGSGSDALTMVNWNDAATPLYGDTFAVTTNTLNRFWSMPPYELNGTVTISLENGALTADTEALAPTEALSSLLYQWYKDGEMIADATGRSYTLPEEGADGVYYCVVSVKTDPYYGSVASNVVTVTNEAISTLDPPTLDSKTSTSITLADPNEAGKTYEYSIDFGKTWQEGLTFDKLSPGTTYQIIRREKNTTVNSGPLTVTTYSNAPSVDGKISYNYYNEWIYISPSIEVFRDENCTEGNRVAAGSVITPGEQLYARFTGDTRTGADAVTSFHVPERPDAPEITVVSQTSDSITIRTENGVAYNYVQSGQSISDGTAFTGDGTNHTINNLAAGTGYILYARYPATDAAFHSKEGKYQTGTRPAAPAKSVVQINYAEETLTFDGDIYEVSTGNNFAEGTLIENGASIKNNIPAAGSEAKTLYVRVKANGNIPESLATTFALPARPAITANANGVQSSDETVSGKNDGTIRSLNAGATYQLSSDNGVNWTDQTAAEGTITGLADGTYKLLLKATENSFASAEQDNIIIKAGAPLIVTLPENPTGYTLNAVSTRIDWQGTTTLTFTLADGYSKTNDFAITASYDTGTTGTPSLTENSDGTYTLSNVQGNVTISVTGVADVTPPYAKIEMKNNSWEAFLETITFGKFFKNNVDVTVTARDTNTGSGIKSVEYLFSETGFDSADAANRASGWTELESKGDNTYEFSIAANKKASVYIRVRDNADNTTIINSEGIVIYADAQSSISNISLTKLSETDVDIFVTLNGNTVKSITLKEEGKADQTIAASNYTVGTDGTITLKASYLQTLAAGTYTLQVDYDPMGVSYVDDTGNEAPASTTATLTVQKNSETAAALSGIPTDTITYGDTFNVSISGASGTGNVTYESTNTDVAAVDSKTGAVTIVGVGSFTIKATKEADANYNVIALESANLTTVKKALTISGVAIKDKQYDGTNEAEFDGTPTDKEEPSETNEAPATGDHSNYPLWIILMLASGAVLTGIAIYGRRKKQDR